jgi:hypothetical protein
MGKVISFGDSFVVGLGTDREYESSLMSDNPNWKKMSEDEKAAQRQKVNDFRRQNSFTAFFAEKLKMNWVNEGRIGCDNQAIISQIFDYDLNKGFDKDDIILVSFTSSLRDKPSWMPDVITKNTHNGISFSFGEIFRYLNALQNLVWKDDNISKKYDKFTRDYFSRFIVEFWDERYYQMQNTWMISLIQHLFNTREVKYILMDGFEEMLSQTNKYLDYNFYWGYNEFCRSKFTIYSYLKSFQDDSLLELDGWNMNDAKKHPSKKGHEIFANQLLRYYNEVY